MVGKNTHSIFNEEGHLDENSLALCSEWLIGKVEAVDEEILNHLQECHQCKSDALEISEILSLDESAGTTVITGREKFEETCAAKHSPSIKPDSGMNFWRVAAVLAVLAAVTALTILIKPVRKSDGNGNIVKLDSPAGINQPDDTTAKDTAHLDNGDTSGSGVVIESAGAEKYAGNYNVNPALEALIGARFRSGKRPSVQSPPQDTTVTEGQTLLFTWTNKTAEDLELQIMDNTGKQVATYSSSGNEKLLVTFDLSPGLYYWKLLGKEDLYQVGKVAVNSKDQSGPD